MIFMRKNTCLFVACHTANYPLAKLNVIIAFFVHRSSERSISEKRKTNQFQAIEIKQFLYLYWEVQKQKGIL